MKQTGEQKKNLKLNTHDKIVLSDYAHSLNFHPAQEFTSFDKNHTYKETEGYKKGFN